MFENCPPLFFLEGVASGKKNQDTRPSPSGGGGGGKKRKKKEKERNSNRKKFVIHCLKEAHKVRRRSKKYRSYFRSPKITEDAPRGSRMIFPRRFYSRRVLEKDERMDEDSVIIGGREREETIKREKEKRSRIKIRVKNDTMYPIK